MSISVKLNNPIGTYVEYKGKVQLVVSINESAIKYKIMNPDLSNVKLEVNISSVKPTDLAKAIGVVHNNDLYIVTSKKLIISMATLRVMKWDENHGIRKSILEAIG